MEKPNKQSFDTLNYYSYFLFHRIECRTTNSILFNFNLIGSEQRMNADIFFCIFSMLSQRCTFNE